MKKISIETHGHKIVLGMNRLSGKERVWVDGRMVSEKQGWFYSTSHIFTLEEGNEKATYELESRAGMMWISLGYALRRNGIAIAAKP